MSRKQGYWICQIGGWTLINVVSCLIMGLTQGFGWDVVLNYALAIGLAIGVTHAFRAYARSADWVHMPLRQLVPRVLGTTLLLSAVYTGIGDLIILSGLIDPVGMDLGDYWSAERVLVSVFGSSMLMFMWLVIYFGVHYFWNFRQAEVDKWKLEAQAEAARLQALKLQLNPHFFFNSLNSVRALIAEDPDRAQRMVTRLARLLRSTLQVDDVKTVPLKEELSTVRTYLELEAVRFEDRLRYDIEASEDALRRPVPFLLVQTLVENGIKHGIADQQEGGTITVDAHVVRDNLRIEVTNPGTMDTEEEGVGLANARERLGLLFGDRATLTVDDADSETVVATALLPGRSRTREANEASRAQRGESLSGTGSVSS